MAQNDKKNIKKQGSSKTTNKSSKKKTLNKPNEKKTQVSSKKTDKSKKSTKTTKTTKGVKNIKTPVQSKTSIKKEKPVTKLEKELAPQEKEAFKIEKEPIKKVEVSKKKKTEEKDKRRKLIILLLLLFLFFFFILDVDDLILGKPLKPRLNKPEGDWSNKTVVKIEKDSITRKELAYYLYCVRQDRKVNKCSWKKTETKNVVVSQSGTNYVWFKGVTEEGKVGKPSKPVVVKIDNEAPEILDVSTKTTSTSVKVKLTVKDEDSGINKYYYKIDDSEFIESKKDNYTFKDLDPGKEYKITIKVVDKLGNEKEIEFTVRTKDLNNKEENNSDSSDNSNIDSNNNNNSNNNTNFDNDKNTTNNNQNSNNIQDNNTNTNNNNQNNNDNKSDLEEIPKISLSGVPTTFKYGENYKLPTNYRFGKSGGKVTCSVKGKEYKDTKTLPVGKMLIVCEAKANTGVTVRTDKVVEVTPLNFEEEIWDGWIRMNLYFPEKSTNWKWRVGKEEEVRTGKGNTGWNDYTGPITVRLTDVENVYISYKLENGEEVVVAPNGKLVVDIVPESYSIKENEKTKINIIYEKDAEKKQYRINRGEWKNYTESFEVGANTSVEARVIKTTKTYDENGNLESSKKQTNYDSIYISTIVEETQGEGSGSGSSGGSSGSTGGSTSTDDDLIIYGDNYVPTPTYTISGPIISVTPEDLTEEVEVTLTTTKQARVIYYKTSGNGSYKKYEEPFTIDKNTTIYAYYIEENSGQTSKTSSKYISNIKQNNKPYVAINLSTTKSYQESVDVTLVGSDYETIEYSLDGEIYYPYTNSFTVTSNCTIYAKATNQYGTTYESRSITNIGDAPTPKENLIVAIFTNPESSKKLINKTTVEIQYDKKAEKKYYKIGNGKYQEYNGPFEVNKNTTITGYAVSENGSGKSVKIIDFLTTGVAEPTISLNTYYPTSTVEVTIDYDQNASVKKYRIGTGNLIDYTGKFRVDENETIYAYSENELKDTSESYYNITNIIEQPRYSVLDQGSYIIIKLNYPESSQEDKREYKWQQSGEWKKYSNQGILLIKKEHKDEIVGEDSSNGISVKDSNGNIITFKDHYYIVDKPLNELMENLFMRWDYVETDKPIINLSTTQITKSVDITIDYNIKEGKKEYKIVREDGTETEWLTYEEKIKIAKNNTTIYARSKTEDGKVGKIESKKITNIDEENPEIEVRGDLTTLKRKVTLQLIGTDDLKVHCVGWAKGEKKEEYFQDVAALQDNYSTFTVEENGIYTVYVEDEVGNTKLKQIEIKNIDKTAPNISINVLTKKYGEEVEVEIDYGTSTNKQYKIGTTGEYKEYNKKFTIKSQEVTGVSNSDGTITIYAKGTDEEGNEQEVSEIIYALDCDIPKAPVINARSGYPVLTEYGVKHDDVVSITYDNRDDIINYVSMDGENWTEYTGVEHVTSGTIYAKSVKKSSGLTVSTSKKVTMPTDALGIEAYDDNERTYVNSGSYYLMVDSKMIGKKIDAIAHYTASYDSITFTALSDSGESLITVGKSNPGNPGASFSGRIMTIPEGTVKIKIDINRYVLCELTINTETNIKVEEIYPILKEYGIEEGYNSITLDYYSTSVKREYRIDGGKWQEYQDKNIKLTAGKTIETRGTDINGKETLTSSYTSIMSTGLPRTAYDNNQATYANSGSYYLMVDRSMIGKSIKGIAHYTAGYDSIIFTALSDGGESLIVVGKSNPGNPGASFSGEIMTIPEETVKIKIDINRYVLCEIGPTTTTPKSYASIREKPEVIEPEDNNESENIKIPNFIASPTINVSDSDKYTSTKTVSISYPSGGYTNEYSYDAQNWNTYTGNITVDKETTIFARSVSNGEIISSSSYQITKIDNVKPTISLNDVPLKINLGEEYNLPSNYSFNGNKTGGTVKCLLDDTIEVTSTKNIGIGVHHIKCSATTGSGLTEIVEMNIEVIDSSSQTEEQPNIVQEETTIPEEKSERTQEDPSNNQTIPEENQEGVVENEENNEENKENIE